MSSPREWFGSVHINEPDKGVRQIVVPLVLGKQFAQTILNLTGSGANILNRSFRNSGTDFFDERIMIASWLSVKDLGESVLRCPSSFKLQGRCGG